MAPFLFFQIPKWGNISYYMKKSIAIVGAM